MKRLCRFTLYFLLFGSAVRQGNAAYTSLYIFGDSVSTTTNNTTGGTNYFGQRFTNGRDWVEVLAERQGLTYESNKNWSYFGHYSFNLVTNVSNFTAPGDANTALFVVWIINADTYSCALLPPGTNITTWTTTMNQSQTNHFKAVTNLFYAKGARTIIMPNAVDLTASPQFASLAPANKSFIRQRCMDFNNAFSNTLNQIRAACPGITIYSPDMFTLFDNIMTSPTAYGMTITYPGAVEDLSLVNKSLNGPGTNYVWWDKIDPSAKFHMHIAELVQQLMSPVQFSGISSASGSSQLNITNVPIGRDGIVEGSADFTNWTMAAGFESTNATQTVTVPVSDPVQFYRLRFPFVWTWP